MKGHPRKVACATPVKGTTSMSNDWLAKRLHIGDPAAMCQLVNQMRNAPASFKIPKKYEKDEIQGLTPGTFGPGNYSLDNVGGTFEGIVNVVRDGKDVILGSWDVEGSGCCE